jgi:HEAT repeat protein
MTNSARMTNDEKVALLSENTQWRAVTEQVVFALGRAKDPDAGRITVWLMHWLNEPKNVRRTLQMTISEIIATAKRTLV